MSAVKAPVARKVMENLPHREGFIAAGFGRITAGRRSGGALRAETAVWHMSIDALKIRSLR